MKKILKKIIYLSLLALIWVSPDARADKLYLRNGNTIEGDIQQKNDNFIVFSPEGSDPIRYYWDEIDNIDGVGAAHLRYDQANQNNAKVSDYDEEQKYKTTIKNLFTNEKFEELEVIALDLRKNEDRMRSGVFRLDIFYQGFYADEGTVISNEKFIEKIKAWISQYPNSITAKTSLINAYIDLAWVYRGSGYSSTVSDSGAENYKKYLNDAWILCQDGFSSNEKDPKLYVNCLIVAKGLGFSKKETFSIYESAVAIAPEYYPIYKSMAVYLLPRWFGDAEDLDNFAQDVLNRTRDRFGATIYVWVIDYMRVQVENLADHNFSWDTLKQGFEDLRAQFPDSTYILNSYCWFASYFNDHELASSLFEKIGDNWNGYSTDIWVNKLQFDQAKKKSQGDPVAQTALNIQQIIEKDDVDDFKAWVDSGADINTQDSSGQTPLDLALYSSKFGIALLLLEAKCKVNIKDHWGRTAIHFAAMINAPPKILSKIIERGGNLNTPANDLFTPLHYAAKSGAYNALGMLLIDPEFNVNPLTINGKTPLHLAAEEGKDISVQLLVSHEGILLDQKDQEGNTPLLIAVKRGFLKIVEILLDGDADVQVRNYMGLSALDLANQNNKDEIVQLLLDHGADASVPLITQEMFNSARRYNDIASEQVTREEFEKARIGLNEALKLNPYLSEVYLNLAVIAFNQDHDDKKTLEYLTKSIELKPTNDKACYWNAHMLEKDNQMDEAMKFYKAFLGLAPSIDFRVEEIVARLPELKNEPAYIKLLNKKK